MGQIVKVEHKKLLGIAIALFILFYPMLISIYVFLPLFIGSMAYILIRGIEKEKSLSIAVATIYLLNLEVNLSLPLFLVIISSLFFYVTIYPSLKYFRRCKVCKPLLAVILLDLFYLGALFSFDFIFQTQSIVLDSILLYSLIVDMLIVVIL